MSEPYRRGGVTARQDVLLAEGNNTRSCPETPALGEETVPAGIAPAICRPNPKLRAAGDAAIERSDSRKRGNGANAESGWERCDRADRAVQWKAAGQTEQQIEQSLPRWQVLLQIESLVVRSHQRCGRITVPRAAIAQISASMTKLANKKKPPLRSCMERGTTFTTSCYSKCTTYWVCHPHWQVQASAGSLLQSL